MRPIIIAVQLFVLFVASFSSALASDYGLKIAAVKEWKSKYGASVKIMSIDIVKQKPQKTYGINMIEATVRSVVEIIGPTRSKCVFISRSSGCWGESLFDNNTAKLGRYVSEDKITFEQHESGWKVSG